MPITVDYEEQAGSPTETIGEQGLTARRVLTCAWADRITLAVELYGTAYKTYAAVARSISIEPFHEGEVDGASGDDTTAEYTTAQLTVDYRTPEADDSTGGGGTETTGPGGASVTISESIEPTAEFLTLENEKLYWDNATPPVLPVGDDAAAGKLMTGFDWVYTRHNVSSVPSAVLTLAGKVNNASLTSPLLGFTCLAETLLFNPPQLTRKVELSIDGGTGLPVFTSTIDLTYRFSYKPGTWNKFYRTETGAFAEVYDPTGTLLKPFDSGDFTAVTG